MILKKFLIAGGNPTLLVWDSLKKGRKQFISTYLGQVDQIGFVKKNGIGITLNMMGGELCVNALLALTSTLEPRETLFLSESNQTISFTNKGTTASIALTLPYTKIGNIVILHGIGYLVTKEKENVAKKKAAALSEAFKLPAFGIVLYKGSTIWPYVYVKKTNSFIQESACGSGSIAFNIFSNTTKVKQPTGEYIQVKRNNQSFIITARVTN